MHEETAVESIIGSNSMREIFAEVTVLLQAGNREIISHALGFVRDAALYKHPGRDALNEHLKTSSIWTELGRLLYVQDFHLRKDAIYTIGKLTHRERSHLLYDAFPFYLRTDPLNIPSLIGELLWLTNEWNWLFLQEVAGSSHYLQRWSLCLMLDDNGGSAEVAERCLSILSILAKDSYPCVAAEANLRAERIKVKLGPKLTKPEWRKETKRIARLEPRLTFERMSMEFMRDREGYTFAEFDEFLEQQLSK